MRANLALKSNLEPNKHGKETSICFFKQEFTGDLNFNSYVIMVISFIDIGLFRFYFFLSQVLYANFLLLQMIPSPAVMIPCSWFFPPLSCLCIPGLLARCSFSSHLSMLQTFQATFLLSPLGDLIGIDLLTLLMVLFVIKKFNIFMQSNLSTFLLWILGYILPKKD